MLLFLLLLLLLLLLPAYRYWLLALSLPLRCHGILLVCTTERRTVELGVRFLSHEYFLHQPTDRPAVSKPSPPSLKNHAPSLSLHSTLENSASGRIWIWIFGTWVLFFTCSQTFPPSYPSRPELFFSVPSLDSPARSWDHFIRSSLLPNTTQPLSE